MDTETDLATMPPADGTEAAPAPPNLTAEEAQFLDEEAKYKRSLDEARANYLLAELELEETPAEELERRREAYNAALHSLILHKCNYAILNGDKWMETRTMGEHLLEIITTTIIHDRDRRSSVCDQFSQDKLGNRIKKFIETRPKIRFTITMLLGSTAILGAHIGVLPESMNSYFEYAGEIVDSTGAGLGIFTYASKRRALKQDETERQELEQREAAMLGDLNATERFVGLLSDYVSKPHHNYFVDKVHKAQGEEELAKIIDELEMAIEEHAAHYDIRDIAELVKRYYKEVLSDGGLLQQLENSPDQADEHKKIILAIMAQELSREELERDELSSKLGLVAAATVGIATLGGGAAFGYHPLEIPLPEDDDSKKH